MQIFDINKHKSIIHPHASNPSTSYSYIFLHWINLSYQINSAINCYLFCAFEISMNFERWIFY